jgi:hypothetical protein
MSNTVTISCILNTTDPVAELGFEAWVDNTKFIDVGHVTEQQHIAIEIPDDDAEHELIFVLKHKIDRHTQIDENNKIVSDATLTLTELAFDEIKLGHMAAELAIYTHDFNGTGTTTQDKFYGVMGCNGTVSLKFITPIYLWLLENM